MVKRTATIIITSILMIALTFLILFTVESPYKGLIFVLTVLLWVFVFEPDE